MLLHLPSNRVHSSILQLWFARVGDHSLDIEHAIQPLLSLTEKQRLLATGNTNKRREFLLSRALMRHALQQQFGHPEQHWQFIDQPNQAPTISNLPAHFYFSLTHSKGTICFALASCPIGIDLEKIRDNRDFIGLAKTVMSNEEITLLEQNPDNLAENFYRSWCAKEAYYKMLPKEQQSGLSFKELSVPALQKDTVKTALFIRRNAEFMLAVVSQEICEQITCHAFPSNHPLINELAESFG
jgi:phosphopantetheine--protein transferase-like protein